MGIGSVISGAASWVKNTAEDAVDAGADALKGAQDFVGDRLDDIDQAKDWVGGKIDGAVQGAEHAVDGFRQDLVEFGEEHGGIVGKALAENVSNTIGVVEGAGLAVYDMGKGVVQLADGASKLVNPLEWATHGGENLQRLENVGKAAETLGNLASPTAWITNTDGNLNTAKALWDGVTAGYQDAAAQGDWSKFVGRGVVDIGSLLIGVGEANAAIKGAQGASAVARIGEGANALDKAADAARVLDAAGDAGKAARGADAAADAGKVARGADDVGDAAKVAVRTVEQDRALISGLSKAGKIEEARAVLRPFVESGDLDGVLARLDVSAPKDGAYFWSGVKNEAGDLAARNGGLTLETTPGGRVVDNWKVDVGGKQVDLINQHFPYKNADGSTKPMLETFWGRLSHKYAESARGEVFVVQSPEKAAVGGGDVWKQVELPALKDGLKTGRITQIHDPVIVTPAPK
jgi:hypothetical protein